jgi:fructose-1,6-bisphosphatase/inositol monophosphatase family enzyme
MALKEIMRRAMDEIWNRRIGFVGHEKTVKYKADPKDLVTDADLASQKIFVRKLKEGFPGYGIVAEENGFSKKCTLRGRKLFFTVDPLDGTKAFGRKQSQGFGPMLSLSTESQVISAFVGDAMTMELYYYRPDSKKVHRLNFGDHQYERLSIDPKRPLSDQYVLLRDNPFDLPGLYNCVAQSVKHGGVFKDIEIAGGGIGTGMARLWKGEVGAYVIKAGIQTPWDLLPIWGISEKLGFRWMTFDEPSSRWVKREVKPSMFMTKFEDPSIIVHKSRINEFKAGARRYLI